MKQKPDDHSFMELNDHDNTPAQGDRGHQPRSSRQRPFLRPEKPQFLSLPPMRYQDRYVWLLLVSALDLILTMLVLFTWKGYEVNPVAAAVIQHLGFSGAIGLKFGLVILVILICEVIGRRSDRDGRSLATGAILIGAVPVVYTFVLLLRAGPPPA